ncbi:hypothetical protein, partial [Salmonella enterica]|uniref:hypothetical protein n=1 Tax=Salmonella enterica TaxID=28901 RepID=UPI000C2038C0
KTVDGDVSAEGEIVFPAPAGINRQLTLFTTLLSSVPRASRDKSKRKRLCGCLSVCSPRQRG